MLNLKWKNIDSSSAHRPLSTDTFSSPKVVYVRKNIIEKFVKDEQSNEQIQLWNYDEAILTPEEYIEYQSELNNPGTQSLKDDNEILMEALAEIYELLLQ